MDRYPNPLDMEQKIRAEAEHLLKELLAEGKPESPADENRPIPVGKDNENVIWFYRKEAVKKQDEYLKVRFEAVVGSPLYIALYLKRYGEAAELLKQVPDSADPGYAALPVTVYYKKPGVEINDPEDQPELTFHLDQAVYLQDMVLMDKDIPDDLFVALCRRLAGRKESGIIDLPCRYEDRIGNREDSLAPEDTWGYEERRGNVPSLIKEFACWTDLKSHYGNLIHMDEEWAQRQHSPLEVAANRKEALSDEKLFWKVLKGLRRLKKLDERLFLSWVDERTAAHFLVRYMFVIFNIVSSHFTHAFAPRNLAEMKEPIDISSKAVMLKTALNKLGFDEVPADVLWDAFTDLGCGVTCICSSFWVGLELWKLVFQKGLTLKVKEDVQPVDSHLTDRSMGLLAAMFCGKVESRMTPDGVKEQFCPLAIDDAVDFSKSFLEILDGVQWDAKGGRYRDAFLECRHEAEEAVIKTQDKELLYMCLMKNVFPASDMMFLSGRLSGRTEDVMPLMIMKQHGCL